MSERIKQLENVVAMLQAKLERLESRNPKQPNSVIIRRGVAQEDIAVNSGGLVKIRHDPTTAGDEPTITAHLDWCHGGEQVSNGKQVFVAWIRDRWVLIGAECE